MSIEEDSETKLLGFRINKTVTIIIAFFSLNFFIQCIPQLFNSGQSLVLLFIFNTIPEILANIGSLIQAIINFAFSMSLIGLALTIFILCVKKQKSFRPDDNFVKWFSFRATKTSLATLFIFSLIFIISESFGLYSNIITLIDFIPYTSIPLIVFVGVMILVGFNLLGINIYTLIICVKNRANIR